MGNTDNTDVIASEEIPDNTDVIASEETDIPVNLSKTSNADTEIKIDLMGDTVTGMDLVLSDTSADVLSEDPIVHNIGKYPSNNGEASATVSNIPEASEIETADADSTITNLSADYANIENAEWEHIIPGETIVKVAIADGSSSKIDLIGDTGHGSSSRQEN